MRISLLGIIWMIGLVVEVSHSTEPAVTAPRLDGSAWVLSALPGRALVTGAAPTARFADGLVSGSDGCNRYSMPFTLDGESVRIGPQGPSTMMACGEETMEQARVFLDALLSTRRIRQSEAAMDLLDESGVTVATFSPQAELLFGTVWHVIHYNTGRALVGIVNGSEMNMVFDEKGRVSGTAGCNRYFAAYSECGYSLRFSDIASTRMACPDRVIMEQEAAFLQALEWVAGMRFEGDHLDLLQEDGSMAIILRRAPCRAVMD